jgi:beta-glucosidase
MTFRNLKFPEGFLWGSAAAAHQTEGGNHNSWSEWEKIPGKISDGSNSSIACDHYNRYEEDFDLAKRLGHQVHRFSIEWSRIEPKQGKWNEQEIEHYRKVVQALVDRDIQPMVTLHHFTEPVWFDKMDSWLNPEAPEIFAPFCRRVAESLSDFDIIWNTINEPMEVVRLGYLTGDHPPGIQDFGKAMIVGKHTLMAHGQAATQIRQVYDEKGKEQPIVFPVLSVAYLEANDPDNRDDVELAQYIDNLYNQTWITGAITATLPEPAGSGEHYEPLKDSVDMIGLNYYFRNLISSELDYLAGEEVSEDPDLPRCEGLDWVPYPDGYYHIIKDFWEKWKKPIFLTENGIGSTDDSLKRRFILQHLQRVHRVIEEGADIRGYLYWSLTDNFEWAVGYSSHFGLIEIDYETLERRPRESSYMYQEIIESNQISKELQEKYLSE